MLSPSCSMAAPKKWNSVKTYISLTFTQKRCSVIGLRAHHSAQNREDMLPLDYVYGSFLLCSNGSKFPFKDMWTNKNKLNNFDTSLEFSMFSRKCFHIFIPGIHSRLVFCPLILKKMENYTSFLSTKDTVHVQKTLSELSTTYVSKTQP